jgi:hypothetical protein
MKDHLNGTNNRTLCGMKKTDNTVTSEHLLNIDCNKCLDRYAETHARNIVRKLQKLMRREYLRNNNL